MVRDMTTGRPLQRILMFCLPLLIGNLFQQFYNMADSIIVGQFLGKGAFAAVGATGSINFLILGTVLGICSGFSIPIAQEFGAGDMKKMRQCVANSMYLSGIICIIITAFTVTYAGDILKILQTPEDIFQDTYDYLFIIFAGIGATMLYNMLSGILRALGDSRTPLYFLIIASVLNVGLDLLFILVFQMGVAGAGWATVISQFVSGLLCFVYICKRFPLLKLSKDDLRIDRVIVARLLRAGIPMGLQFSITGIGSITIQAAVNQLGSGFVAATAAAAKVHNIVCTPMETMGVAMATYCGQNFGAGRIDRVRQGIRKATIVSLGYSVLAFAIAFFWGESLSLMFISASETTLLSRAHMFLTYNGLFYPPLVLICVYRNSLQGLGYSGAAMFAGVFELVGRLAVATLLVGKYGFIAICFANPAAWVGADLLLLPLYFYKIRGLTRMYNARQSLLHS